MRKIVFCIFFLVPHFLYSQFEPWNPGVYDYKKCQLDLSGHYFIDAQNLTNSFINAYRKGEYIDKGKKDMVLDKLNTQNKIGAETGVNLFYRKAIDSLQNKGWFVGLTHSGIVDARFTKDLFHLYFYGNKPFAGTTADLGELKYNQVEYQQLKGGIYKVVNRGLNTSVYGIGLGYVNGQDIVKVKTASSSLFTAADATYLLMDLSLEATHADSANHKFGSVNGSGAALTLFYQYEKKNNYILTVQLEDVGFIGWNKKTTFFKVDTNYYFDGIEVTNLLDSVFLEVKSVDDYKNSFLQENRNEKTTTFLPAMINIKFEKWINKQTILLGLNIHYRFSTLQLPVISLKGTWAANKNIFAGIAVQYGGYNGLHAGVHAGAIVKKHFIIEAGSQLIDGLLMGKSRAGQGAFLRLGTRF